MPPDPQPDGGGESASAWDDHTFLQSPAHEQWFPTSSASNSNLIYYTANFENHPQFTDTSVGNPGAIPAANPRHAFFNNPSHPPFDYDIHQGQHWADLPTHDDATTTATTVPLTTGAEWTTPLALVESPRESTGSAGEVLGKADNDKRPRQDLTISHSLLSPSRSVVPAPKPLAAEPNKPRRTTKPPREEPRAQKPPPNLPMSTGSGYSSPNAGQGSFDRKKILTGPRGTSLNRMYSKNTPETLNEEELRRKQPALNSRGPSRVSSVSGHSQNEAFSSDMIEDEFSSNTSRISENRGAGRTPGVLRTRQGEEAKNGQHTLPHAKGFSIQIGSENFKLSGASIMSDAPSYFSRFFEEQLRQGEGPGGLRTLYIDRDPVTFHDICRHLQGYYVQPRDGSHFVKLFADAQFYSLPRLISQLYESGSFVQIGGENFQIPRDLFTNPGDEPNYFSLGFAHFFSTPNDVFPGLDSGGLLRPPSVHPPSVPNRSAKVFSDILHLLRGYPLQIRDKHHRAELLRDCRYFNLRGLEQKLIVHNISYNSERAISEIIIRLEDIRQSGVSFVGDASPSDRSPLGGWVNYSRPFVDETSYEIIVEIGDESTCINFRTMRADFYGDAKARISSLFQVVANKMNLPTNAPLGLMMSSGGAAQSVSPGNTPLSEDRVKICIGRDAHIVLDGEEYVWDGNNFENHSDFENTEPTSPGPVRSGIPSTPSSAGLNPTSSWSTPTLHAPPQSHTQPLNFQHPPRQPSPKPPPRKRKRRGSLDEFGEWIIRKGQWRLRVQPRLENSGGGGDGSSMEIVLHAVKLDALSGQKGRNMMRGYLTSE